MIYYTWIYLLAMVILKPVSSLLCYECTISDDVKNCGEKIIMGKINITNCENSIYTVNTDSVDDNKNDEEFACILMKETSLIGNNTVINYTRRCSVKNLNDTCENLILINKEKNLNIKTDCLQCETDFCNSSSSSSSINFMIVSGILIKILTLISLLLVRNF